MKFAEIKEGFLFLQNFAKEQGNMPVFEECEKILASKGPGKRKVIAFAEHQMRAASRAGADGGKTQLAHLGPEYMYKGGMDELDAWVAERKIQKALEEDIELEEVE